MATGQPKAPTLERLLMYIKKASWQHVSASFTGFAKKEFESILDKLDEDQAAYPNIHRIVRDCELGRFTSTKELWHQAEADLEDIQKRLTDLDYERRNKLTARGQPHNAYGSHLNESRDTRAPLKGPQDAYQPDSGPKRETFTPQKRDTFTPPKRETFTPQKRDTFTPPKRETFTPQKRDTFTPPKRETYTPQKRETYSPEKRVTYSPNTREVDSPEKRAMATYSPQKHQRDTYSPEKSRSNSVNVGHHENQKSGQHEIAQRGEPRTPLKNDHHYDSRTGIDPHKENFDSLRLNSPDRNHEQNRYHPNDQTTDRPIKHSLIHAKDQSSSAAALWGQEHGDASSEKTSNSTYRHAYPGHAIDTPERVDTNKYRENFSSLNERSTWARMDNEGSGQSRSRYGSESFREPVSPDQRPPMELIMQFKDLYNTEWKDAYDETCAVFGGPEKTVRHLLWIVTEAYLIACDIADHQLRDLEKQAFGVMITPGHDKDHVANYRGRELGDALPKSKTLLLQYRKQTAPLSVPYVRETCRDKISRTLMESVHFPKTYLNNASRLVAYIYKCAELTWLMSVQEPPIILEYITKDSEGSRFNREHYVEYNKRGPVYDYGVWPLLRHGKNGQIVYKGIAQAI